MPRDVQAEVGRLQEAAPTFNTQRFVLAPLAPPKAKEVLGVLLQDEKLADQLPWMESKTADGAQREAFLIELQCTSGATQAWGIIERARGAFVGAALARQTLGGIDLEVLCASQFWNQGISDEVSDPLAQWLEDNTEVLLSPTQ